MKRALLSRRSLLLAAIARAAAQEAKFSTSVNVVTLLATVRNRDGGIVKDLSKDDFVLEEDGHPQTIRYFSRESNLPLTIGLLVDASRSEMHMLEPERKASYVFSIRPSNDKNYGTIQLTVNRPGLIVHTRAGW